MTLQAGLGRDVINFVICCIIFFVIGYFVSYFMIGKFNFATPGRNGNYLDDGNEVQTDKDSTVDKKENKKIQNNQAEEIIGLLGGRENILEVDACMTRLRVTVKDVNKVADAQEWKSNGALGLIKKNEGIQAIYGTKADVLKSDINDIL